MNRPKNMRKSQLAKDIIESERKEEKKRKKKKKEKKRKADKVS